MARTKLNTLSPTSIVKWLKRDFTELDERFYKEKENDEQFYKTYQEKCLEINPLLVFEKEVETDNFYGFIDIYNPETKTIYENKIRSNDRLDKYFLLQLYIYTVCLMDKDNCADYFHNAKIQVFNRNDNFKKTTYVLQEQEPVLIDWCEKVVDFILANFEEVSKAIAKGKELKTKNPDIFYFTDTTTLEFDELNKINKSLNDIDVENESNENLAKLLLDLSKIVEFKDLVADTLKQRDFSKIELNNGSVSRQVVAEKVADVVDYKKYCEDSKIDIPADYTTQKITKGFSKLVVKGVK